MSVCPSKFDWFCYVCGKHTIKTGKMQISEVCAQRYEQYFNMPIFRDVPWAPTIICRTCDKELREWATGKRISLSFGIPMIWSDPGVHTPENCYACANNMSGFTKSLRTRVVYKQVAAAQTPLPHSEFVPVPKRPSPSAETAVTLGPSIADESTLDPTFEPPVELMRCDHIDISQLRLNTMIRQLKLSKRRSVILAGHLRAVNILASDVKISSFRNRQAIFAQYYTANQENTFAYCHDIGALMISMNIEYAAEDWRLFIDGSKTSLKAVLLFYNNSINPVPLAFSKVTKETYESLKQILEMIKWNEHQWRISADLKVIALLSGLQTGYTKHMCYLCLWDTRYRYNQYEKRNWETRQEFLLNVANVVHVPLVPKEKILLPPLHIKLGIVKNFLKTLDHQKPAFKWYRKCFPGLSSDKLNEGKQIHRSLLWVTADSVF